MCNQDGHSHEVPLPFGLGMGREELGVLFQGGIDLQLHVLWIALSSTFAKRNLRGGEHWGFSALRPGCLGVSGPERENHILDPASDQPEAHVSSGCCRTVAAS